jgi:hypothetical protein
VWDELHAARNFKGSFKNLYTGLIYGGIYKLLEGKEPFELRNKAIDSDKTEPANKYKVMIRQHSRSSTLNTIANLPSICLTI